MTENCGCPRELQSKNRLLLTLTALIRLTFVFLTPAWQAPDKHPLFHYIRALAETGKILLWALILSALHIAAGQKFLKFIVVFLAVCFIFMNMAFVAQMAHRRSASRFRI